MFQKEPALCYLTVKTVERGLNYVESRVHLFSTGQTGTAAQRAVISRFMRKLPCSIGALKFVRSNSGVSQVQQTEGRKHLYS